MKKVIKQIGIFTLGYLVYNCSRLVLTLVHHQDISFGQNSFFKENF